MHELSVEIAEEILRVRCRYDPVANSFAEYKTEKEGGKTFFAEDSDITDMKRDFARMDEQRGNAPVWRSRSNYELQALHKLIAEDFVGRGLLLVHGSAVVADGKAYLFIAPSGTGKSTHTSLWCSLPGVNAVVINDDKQLMRPTAEGVFVYPTPWGCAKKPDIPKAKLEALVVLTQGDETVLSPVTDREIFLPFYKASLRGNTPEQAKKILELQQKIMNGARLYKMRCTPTPEAAQIAYRTLVLNS